MYLQISHPLLLASKLLSWKPSSCLKALLAAQTLELGVIKSLNDTDLYDTIFLIQVFWLGVTFFKKK